RVPAPHSVTRPQLFRDVAKVRPQTAASRKTLRRRSREQPAGFPGSDSPGKPVGQHPCDQAGTKQTDAPAFAKNQRPSWFSQTPHLPLQGSRDGPGSPPVLQLSEVVRAAPGTGAAEAI